MKKMLKLFGFFLFVIFFSGFVIHKFYIATYQVNYVPEKKMLQITARIFADDLDKVLEKKYGKKIYLGEKNEIIEADNLLKNYFLENFSVKINGENKQIIFINKEKDANDVIICYAKIININKIKWLEMNNSVLTDLTFEQQNIVNFMVLGIKKSTLFTSENKKQNLTF